MEGLLLLRDAVGKEKRPLSWMVGPQDVEKPILSPRRDIKRTDRQNIENLRPPDEV
jgi:NADH-quinone oxidoreductase subunit B